MFKRTNAGNVSGAKPFYIVLFVCLIAIAVTSYIVTKDTADLSTGGDEEVENSGTPVGSHTNVAVIPGAELETQTSEIKETEPSVSASAQTTVKAEEKEPKETQAPATQEATELTYVKPVLGEVSVPYSLDELIYSKTLDDWRAHAGIDLKAEVGTPVKAFSSGQIADIYTDELMGEIVIIMHSETLFSLYANLSPSIPVKIGDKVEAGDVIGGVGESALVEMGDVPHVHFEVISEGRQVDPMQFFK